MLTEDGAEEEDPDAGLIIFEDDVPLAGEPGSEDIHDYVFAVVDLVNKERAAEGIAPVSLHRDATACAQVRAEEAKKSFSHTRPNGTTCFTALTEAGITYAAAGENLAGKIKTPEKVVDAWMNSPGHRKNIMNPKYSQIGVGYVSSGNYWSQFFVG
jgi:uncharacterized protein YkwD